MADGGRYGRGGYRRNRYGKTKLAKEKAVKDAKPGDGNILDGSALGLQPNEMPGADSDVGGPLVVENVGGDGVPQIGTPVPPPVAGDAKRELDQLEAEVNNDTDLTPPPEVEESVADQLEPQPKPENTPTDEELTKVLGEEPEEEEQAEGVGITLGDVMGEPESSKELKEADPEAEEPEAEEPEAEEPEAEEPEASEPEDDDDVEIVGFDDDEDSTF